MNPDLSSTSTMSVVFERGSRSFTGVGSVAAGDVLEMGLEFVTGIESVVVGVLERRFVFSTGFGATMAGDSFAFAVGSKPQGVRPRD